MPDDLGHEFDRLREVLQSSVEQQRRQLQGDADSIRTDSQIQDTFEGLLGKIGDDMPTDIVAAMQQWRKLRRTRYVQYLRAHLDDLADDIA